ncbi:MAG: hypothetical protein MZV70_67480 [Desulfobacterales bacterium]|nr:hypothetical protein [Desulfobacterales bacterium]
MELINDLPADVKTVSLYTQGGYHRSVPGPAYPRNGNDQGLQAAQRGRRLLAGRRAQQDAPAHLRDGLCATQEDLDEYLHLLEEAKRRDHRRLGRELDLFQLNDEAGAGADHLASQGRDAADHHRGLGAQGALQAGLRHRHGPADPQGPTCGSAPATIDHYRENMYFTEVDEQAYGIKPMNCLSHMLIYKSKIRSYRDLPLRYFELGTVHRHEKTGVLHGLTARAAVHPG